LRLYFLILFLNSAPAHLDLHSFPTRRSSDLHLFVVPLQIRAVTLRNQRALYQRRTAEFAAAFRDPPRSFRLVGVGDARHDPEVRRQFAFVLEIVNVADHAQQDASAQRTDTLNTGEIPVALQLASLIG